MPNKNDRTVGSPAGPDGVEPAYADDSGLPPATPTLSVTEALAGGGSLSTLMPTGEVGPRDSDTAFSTESGGTSKAEDTPRAAGYVADLTRTSEPPPGPPVEKSPEDFAGPDSTTAPPNETKSERHAGASPKPSAPHLAGTHATTRPATASPAKPSSPAIPFGQGVVSDEAP